MTANSHYARRLGVFSATMIVVGGIIGAGIFLSPADVARRVGHPSLILAAWVLGGVIALIGAVCFAELAARMPKAGGSYVYLRAAFGPLPAFLFGWTLLLIIATGATAAVAMIFANYTVSFLGLAPMWIKPLAIAAIAFLAGVNYRGVVPGAVLQNLLVVLKLLPLAVLAVLGLVFAQGDPIGPFAGETFLPSSRGAVWALAAGLGPVLFAFGGWQQLNFVADEITDPRRTIPRALLIGIAIVITVYLAVNVAYLWGLGASGLANSKAPAADTMYAVFGDRGRWLISLGIIVSTFGFLDLVLLVTPRVFQAMAANGQLPARLARLHPRYQTPVAGIVFQAVWASILAGSNTYGALLDYVVFGDWIFFGATVATLFVFRSRQPGNADGEEAGGYRLPGYPVVPALFVMAAAYVVVGSIVSNPINAAIGSGLIALGVPAYHWLGNRGEGPPPA
jgi:APA family basic amino acid/polyamine antiporter